MYLVLLYAYLSHPILLPFLLKNPLENYYVRCQIISWWNTLHYNFTSSNIRAWATEFQTDLIFWEIFMCSTTLVEHKKNREGRTSASCHFNRNSWIYYDVLFLYDIWRTVDLYYFPTLQTDLLKNILWPFNVHFCSTTVIVIVVCYCDLQQTVVKLLSKHIATILSTMETGTAKHCPGVGQDPHMRRTWICWSESTGGPWWGWEDWSSCPMKTGWERIAQPGEENGLTPSSA